MKKLLSICFLSILLAALSFTAQAQVSTDCCFWLENLQPGTLTDLSNAPDGSGQLVLNNTMSPAAAGQTHYYKVRFENNCNLPANTKVSLDLKLYRNGILITEDPAILERFATVSVYTRWDGLVTSSTPGTVNCGQMSWFGGQLNNVGTCQYDANHSNHCMGGYPGSMQTSNTYPWSNTSAEAIGPFSYFTYGLDYFYLNFFEQSENIIAITWKPNIAQFGDIRNLSLVVGLRQRTNGSFNPEYFGDNQLNYIGGHQSCCGALLAQDSIHTLATSHFEKEVCDGSNFDYGRPVHTFDTEGDYLVVFGDSTCGHFRLERLDTLHFFTRENPQVVVNPTHVERCFTHGITSTELASYASFATPDAPGLTYKEIQWSTDNVNFSTTVPTPSTEVGTYNFYVRQSNTYFNFLDSVVCEGPVTTIEYIIHPIPETPVVNDREDFYCVNASNGITAVTIEDHVVASPDCHLVWSKDRDFATTISGAELIPDITTAGVTTYYVYQINDTTGCTGLDLGHVDSVVVTVYSNPDIYTTVEPTIVCEGSSIHVAVEPAVRDAAYTYLWADGRTASSFDTVPTFGNHQYTVTAFETHEGIDLDKPCRTTVTTIPDTVIPAPRKPILAESSVEYCNEVVDATTTYMATATVGEYGTTCVWYYADQPDVEIARGDTLVIDVNALKPEANENKEVQFIVKSYHDRTLCWSLDYSTFALIYHQTPVLKEIAASHMDSICPNAGNTVDLKVEFETETTSPFVYTWRGSVAASTTNATVMNISDQCDSTYATDVFVTDKYGCVSTPKSFSIVAQDHTPLTLNKYSTTTRIRGCADSVLPAAYPTLDIFQLKYNVRIENACNDALTMTSNDATTIVDDNDCLSTIVRTYTITDHCGNTVDFVDTFLIRDDQNPAINIYEPVRVDVVRAQDCKYDAPATENLLQVLNNKISDNCASEEFLTASAEFYFAGTNIRFEGARDLFADSNRVFVDVKITDRCGNSTVKNVIYLERPAQMYITADAATTDYNFTCKQDPDMLNRDSVILSFDSTKVYNAFSPYTFVWSQIPEDGYIANPNAVQTVARPNAPLTNYVYVMTVTDKFGCVYTDTTNTVYVNDVITVNINKNTRDGQVWAEPICPNLQYNLTASCQSNGFWPANMFTFNWMEPGQEEFVHQYNHNVASPFTPNSCEGSQYFEVLATSIATGCKALGRVTVTHGDFVAPVINESIIAHELVVSMQENCTMYVPDFTYLIKSTNTTDNCVNFSALTVTQEPVAGTVMTANTPVVVTVKDPCGNATTMNCLAKIPENFLSVTAEASNYAFCQDTTVTLTATVAHQYGTVTYSWTEGENLIGTNNPQTVTPTADQDEVDHTYVLVVTDGNNCTASDTVTVTTYRKPVLNDIQLTSTANTFCDNAGNEYDGTISATLTDAFQYRLSTTSDWRPSGYAYTALYQGVYNFDVMTNHGCIVPNLANIAVERDTTETIYAELAQTPNTSCVANNGIITVSNLGQNYVYTLNTGASFTHNDESSVIEFTDLSAGSYTVNVVTPKHCEYDRSITVTDNMYYPQASDITLTTEPNRYCDNADQLMNGSIAVSQLANGCVYKMSSDSIWHNASYVYENLYQGSYHFDVKTSFGCVTGSVATAVVADSSVMPIRPQYYSNPYWDCARPNGTLSLTNGGVRPGYKFQLIGNPQIITADAQDTVTFNGLYPGSYSVQITTPYFCTATFDNFIVTSNINSPADPNPVIVANSACVDNLANGSIQVTVPQNRYTYVLKHNGILIDSIKCINNSTVKFNNLIDGQYVLIVYSEVMCASRFEKTVGAQPNLPTFAVNEVTTTPRTTCNVENGTIIIAQEAGYTYKVFTSNDVEVTNLAALASGNYKVVKTSEANGCQYDTTVQVGTAYYQSDYEVTVTNNSWCNGITFDGSLAFSNDTLDYTIWSGADDVTAQNGQLPAGRYTVKAVNRVTGCQAAEHNATITNDNQITPEARPVSTPNFICQNIDNIPYNGTVSLYPANNGATIDTFTLNSVSNQTGYFENLVSGTYNFTLISDKGCTSNGQVTVADSASIPEVVVTHTDNYACGPIWARVPGDINKRMVAGNGSITFTTPRDLNDIAHYTYRFIDTLPQLEWVNAAYLYLNENTYHVRVVDNYTKCYADRDVTISTASHNVTVTLDSTDNTICDGTFDGTIVATVNSDNTAAVFTYSLNGGLTTQFSNTFTHLQDGQYTVTVKDTTLNCEYSNTITVNKHNYVYDFSGSQVVNNTNCTGTPNGKITVVVAGTDMNPNRDLRYSLTNGIQVTRTQQTSNEFAELPAGAYVINVKDLNTGCEYAFKDTVIDQFVNPSFTVTPVHNSICTAGEGDGQLVFDPAQSYNYVIYKDAVAQVNVVSNNVLVAGNYYVVATNPTTGCTTTSPVVTVYDSNRVYPNVIATSTADYLCTGNNGTITLTVDNISDELTFSLQGRQNVMAVGQATFDTVNADPNTSVYNYVVTSSKGCKAIGQVTVADSAKIYTVTATTTPDYTCSNNVTGTGTITFDVTLPAGHTYEGRIANPALTSVNNTFSQLQEGIYSYTITDQNTGCSTDRTDTVKSSTYELTLTLASTADTVCEGDHNGTITATASTTDPNYNFLYSLDQITWQHSNVFTGLTPGKYAVTVKDSILDCTAFDSVVVGKHDFTPEWNITSKANYSCTQYNGELTINFVEGTMPAHTYQYSINNGVDYATSNVFTGLTKSALVGGYQIAVKDMQTGCVYNTTADVIDSSAAPQVVINSKDYTKTPFHYCVGQTARLVAVPSSNIPDDTCFYFSWNNYCWLPTSTDSIYELTTEHSCDVYVVVTSCLTGCQTTVRQQITIDTLPQIKFYVDGNLNTSTPHVFSSCENEAHEICIQPTNVDSIQWNEAAGMAVNVPCISAEPMPASSIANYCVMVWDHNGCAPSAAASISVRYQDTNMVHRDTVPLCAVDTAIYTHNCKNEKLLYDYAEGAVNTYTFIDTLRNQHGCDSIEFHYVKLFGAPSLTVDTLLNVALNNAHCAGAVLLASGNGLSTTDGGAFISSGWKVQVGDNINFDVDTVFNVNTPLSLADNGKRVYGWVSNSCSNDTSAVYTLVVSDTVSNIVFNPDTLYCHGNNFNCRTITFTSNVNNGSAIDTVLQYSSNNVDWVDTTKNFTVNFADHGSFVRLKISNCCGTNYSVARKLVVDTLPTGTISFVDTVYCANDTLKRSLITFTNNSTLTDNFANSLKLGDEVYNGRALAAADNGKFLYYAMTNKCQASPTNTNKIKITVNDKPAIGAIAASSNLCLDSYSISYPAITANGSTVTDTTWYLYDAATGDQGKTPIQYSQIASISNSGKYLACSATNGCGTTESARLQLVVKNKPVLAGTISTQTVCAPTAVNVGVVSVSNWNNDSTANCGYKISSDTGATWNTWTNNSALTFGDYKVTYFATNACGTVSADTVDVRVNDVPALLNNRLTANNTCVSGIDVAVVKDSVTNWKHTAAGTQGYRISSDNGATWTDWAYGSTCTDGDYKLAYVATNGCGTTSTDTVTWKVSDVPSVTELTEFAMCKANFAMATPAIDTNNSPITLSTWYVETTPGVWANLDTTAIKAFEAGNYQVRYIAGNTCGNDTTASVALKLYDVPSVNDISFQDTICRSSFVLATPTIDTNNSDLTTNTWQYKLQTASVWTSADSSTIVALNPANYTIRYMVGNQCGLDSSNTEDISVIDSAFVADPSDYAVCKADFNLVAPTITANNSNLRVSTWQYKDTAATVWSGNVATDSLKGIEPGNYHIRYIVKNECSSDTSANAIYTLKDVPVVADITNIDSCKASFDTLVKPSIDSNNSVLSISTWEYKVDHVDSAWIAASQTTIFGLAAGNYELRYVVANDCGNDTSNVAKLVLRDIPSVATLSDTIVCKSGFELLKPTVQDNNSSITNLRWDYDTVPSTGWRASDSTGIVTLPAGNYKLRYVATNGCGVDSTSAIASLSLKDLPKVHNLNGDIDSCSASLISLVAPVVDTNNSDITASGWLYKLDRESAAWVSATEEQVVSLTDTVYQLKYWATNDCGSDTSASVKLTIRNTPSLDTNILVLDTVCTGSTFSASSFVVNNHNGLNNGAEYEISETRDFSAATFISDTTHLTAAHDSSFVRFHAWNDCGDVYSDTVMLVVKDKPALITSTLVDDTVCARVSTSFTEPTINWNHSVGTGKFQMQVGSADFVDTTASMTFDYGTTYKVRYVATNDCATDQLIDGPVTIIVKDTASFDLATISNVCQGNVIPAQMPVITLNGGITTDTTWLIGTDTFDSDSAYAAGTYTITLKVTNECGVSQSSEVAVVDTLPVPHIIGDTTICLDGTATIRYNSSAAYASYQWYVNNAEVAGETTTSFDYTPATPVEGDVHHITLEVVDGNGCKSETNVNDGVDVAWGEYASDYVSVKMTGYSHFIFYDAAGNATHRLPQTQTSTSDLINYSWTVSNPCDNPNELVFVTFDIYRDGQLLPADSIGSYFVEQIQGSGYNSSKWIIRQTMSYLAAPTHTETRSAIYDWVTYSNDVAQSSNLSAMKNHFPAWVESYNLDCIYLDLLSSRTVANVTAPIRQEGDYKFVYKLWKVTNINQHNIQYYDPATNTYNRIGGYNSLASAVNLPIMVMQDSLFIGVNGDYQNAPAPVAPVAPASDDQPTVDVYPNPASTVASAKVNGLYGATTVTVTNSNGIVVYQENINIDTAVDYIYTFDVSNYGSGIYFVQFVAENGIVTKKIVVQR